MSNVRDWHPASHNDATHFVRESIPLTGVKKTAMLQRGNACN